jgi:ubiquinone/menaquinone biosynthesis C-methylase UbiE
MVKMARGFQSLTDIPAFSALSGDQIELVVRTGGRRMFTSNAIFQIADHPMNYVAVLFEGRAIAIRWRQGWQATPLQLGDLIVGRSLGKRNICVESVVSQDRASFILLPLRTATALARHCKNFRRHYQNARSKRMLIHCQSLPDEQLHDVLLALHQIGHRRYQQALDVGTGAGTMAWALSALCRKVIALDSTPEALSATRAELSSRNVDRAALCRGRAEALPFQERTFNLVTSRIAAHHFDSVKTFTSEARRVLKDDGVLCIVDLVAPDEPHNSTWIDWVETVRDPTHRHIFSLTEWQETLHRAGFSIKSVQRIQPTLSFKEWKTRKRLSAKTDSLLSAAFRDQALKNENAFFIKLDPRTKEVISFVNRKIIITATKAPPGFSRARSSKPL